MVNQFSSGQKRKEDEDGCPVMEVGDSALLALPGYHGTAPPGLSKDPGQSHAAVGHGRLQRWTVQKQALLGI